MATPDEAVGLEATFVVRLYGPHLKLDEVAAVVEVAKRHNLDFGIDGRGRIAFGWAARNCSTNSAKYGASRASRLLRAAPRRPRGISCVPPVT